MMTKKAIKNTKKQEPKSSSSNNRATAIAEKPQASVPASTGLNSNQRKSGSRTRVSIRYDVGFANSLYIRGQGAGLSWSKGVALKNVKPDEWVWETEAPFAIVEFKVLINDDQYEDGENHRVAHGAHVQYTPHF